MSSCGPSLPDTINPNNFPAKLWRLVNNPTYDALCWDSQGEAIIIDKQLFEAQILSPGIITLDSADAFKTTNFSSFIRQLNLYGFRKCEPASVREKTQSSCWDSAKYHRFFNPNFRRDQPQLVANLRRLTVDNKAKIQAGQTVNCRPPSRYMRFCGGGDGKDVRRGSSDSPPLLSPTHHTPSHPYHPNIAQATTGHSGTPVPPRYLMRGQGAAFSPAAFLTDKVMPLSLNHQYAGIPSSPGAVRIQQSLLACANPGNPNFMRFNLPNSQYQPDCCSQVCQCYQPNLVASHVTGSNLQIRSLSASSCYQPGYPVDMLCRGEHRQHPQSKENQEVKKCDINLDTIFQIADEVMKTPPNICLVKVETPEKPGHELGTSFDKCNTSLWDNSSSAMKANPLSATPITMADTADVVTYKQQKETLVSLLKEMPEDIKPEVTTDNTKDISIIKVEVSDFLEDSSLNQA